MLFVQTCDPQSRLAPQGAPVVQWLAHLGGIQMPPTHRFEPHWPLLLQALSSGHWPVAPQLIEQSCPVNPAEQMHVPWLHVPCPEQLGPPGQVTVTVWMAVALLPAASTAVQVTVVTPNAKGAGASFVTVTAPGHASTAVGVPRTGVSSTVTVTSGGGVKTGGVRSTTVTFAVHVAAGLAVELTVSVTLVIPSPYGPAGSCARLTATPVGSEEPASTDATVAEQVSASVGTVTS
jgi:hypothetical protein